MNLASVRSCPVTHKAIDEIPLEKRNIICTEIDYSIHTRNGYWEKLVSELGFSERDSKKFILAFERSQSPTENLLRECTYRNYRIGTLCYVLRKIGLVKLVEENLENMGEVYTPSPSNLPWVGAMPAAFEKPRRGTDGDSPTSTHSGSDGDKIGGLDTIHYSYDEIEKGTNYFSPDKKLGAGAFGKVYKVNLKNTVFACKVLTINSGSPHFSIVSKHKEQSDLRNELRYLAEYRHPNIIPLYGWSLDGKDPCLIYQYMKNGSLQDCLQRLKGNESLSWLTRAKAAADAARGLQFLHEAKDKPLIHGDIKTANILLDDSFVAKLGDFGLAREGPRRFVTGSYVKLDGEHTPGTLGYLAMEYMQSKKLSVQVDTYAFGVVLLELYTGRRAFDRTDKKPATLLRDYMDNIASGLGEGGPENAEGQLFEHQSPDIPRLPRSMALKFVKLALECCHEKRIKRPAMSVALKRLEELRALIEELPKQLPASMNESPTSVPPSRLPMVSTSNYLGPLSWRVSMGMRHEPVESEDHSSQQLLKKRHENFYNSKNNIKADSSLDFISAVDRPMERLQINGDSASHARGQLPYACGSPWPAYTHAPAYPYPIMAGRTHPHAPMWPPDGYLVQSPLVSPPMGVHPSYFPSAQFSPVMNHPYSMYCGNMANFMTIPPAVSSPHSSAEPKSDPISTTPMSPATPLSTPEPFSSLDLDGGLSRSSSRSKMAADGLSASPASPFPFYPVGAYTSVPPAHEYCLPPGGMSGERIATSVSDSSNMAVNDPPVKVGSYKADMMERLKRMEYQKNQDDTDIISEILR